MLVATTKDPKRRIAAAWRKALQFGRDYPISTGEPAKLRSLDRLAGTALPTARAARR
jgi:hypothetical protein